MPRQAKPWYRKQTDSWYIELRGELRHLAVLGTPDRLAPMVELLDVERVIIARSGDSTDDPTEIIRRLRDLDPSWREKLRREAA